MTWVACSVGNHWLNVILGCYLFLKQGSLILNISDSRMVGTTTFNTLIPNRWTLYIDLLYLYLYKNGKY